MTQIEEQPHSFTCWINETDHKGGYACFICADRREEFDNVRVPGVATELLNHIVNAHAGEDVVGTFDIDGTTARAELWFDDDGPHMTFDIRISAK